jgi:hypothetical protein
MLTKTKNKNDETQGRQEDCKKKRKERRFKFQSTAVLSPRIK